MPQLLQNAVYGGIMILAAAALRRGLKDRLIPEARLALWAVCLFRLLTPAAPESVLSLWRIFVPAERPAPVSGIPAASHAPVVGTAPAPVAAPAEAAGAGVPWGAVLTAIWVIVGVALAVRFALSYARTRRAVGRTSLLGRDDPRYAPLPKCARLREGAMEGAPLTFGAVRPTVVLTPGLAGAELVCVLTHEGVHARRRDNLWHYVTALALVVHWWNPAVWLMARLLRRDVELSCDRAAVKKLGAEKRAEYANALISMAAQGNGPAFCQTFGRKAAEERVISIMKYKKMTVVGAALTLALVLAVTVGFACNPARQKADDTVEYHGRVYSRSDLSQETLDWLDWYLSLSEEGQMSVSFVPPELIAGLDVSAGGANAGYTEKTAEPDEKAPVDPDWPVSLDGYKALLDQLVADGKMAQADADWLVAGAKQGLEKSGQAMALYVNDSGGYAIKSAPLCALTDCGNTGVHTHDGVTYSGWMNERAIPPSCTDEACADFAPHWHIDGEMIYFYYTMPAKLPVCPVEGCATPGLHTHDGSTATVYTCAGAHSGGVCDGSCLVYFEDYNFQESDVPVGEQGFTHDPRIEDSAGGSDEPTVCPPEAIDKTFGPHTCADCGVEGCTADYLHMHSGSYTFTMGPVCPREDCTLFGSHEHDGVMYSCNGGDGTYHKNGVCDGSCYNHNDLPVYVDPPQSVGQSVSSGQGSGYGQGQGSGSGNGHHSESHHSNHH